MKFFSIFQTYCKRTVRDKMFLLIMLLFPIVLIWILGNAFSGIMGGQSQADDINQIQLLYQTLDESNASVQFETHMTQDNTLFVLQQVQDQEQAKEQVMMGRVSGFVTVSELEIRLYKNSRFQFYSSLAELIIKTYADEYNLMVELMMVDPQSIETLQTYRPIKRIETVSLVQDRQPGSMDYYGITITTMFLLYGIIFMGTYIAGERMEGTKDRVLIAPVKPTTYAWAIILGNGLLLLIQLTIMLMVGRLVFNVYWGDAFFISFLVMAAAIVMACSLGALMGFHIKNEELIAGASQVAIPVLVFLGDGYVQISATGWFLTIKQLSPVYWINKGIFDAIYANDHTKAYISILISLGIALVCSGLLLWMNHKRGNQYG